MVTPLNSPLPPARTTELRAGIVREPSDLAFVAGSFTESGVEGILRDAGTLPEVTTAPAERPHLRRKATL
jgi:hypothetical protein